jgi:hydrophobe/amphiphile efflux-3 (HAE3) family protein
MISTIFEGIARTINRRPLAVAAVVVAVFSLAIFGMTLLSMQTGWETYIDKNSQAGVTYSEYSDNFKSDSIILIIEASDPLDHDILSYIDDLEADIRQQQNIDGTNSVVEVLKSANGGTVPSSREEVDSIIGALPPDIRSMVVPSNMLTLVQIKLDRGLSDNVQQSTLDNVISVVDHAEKPPGVTVEISGSPAFSQQMAQGLMQNMGILIGGAMILMVIVMGILFSYVRYRFMPVLMVGIGLATSLGMMGLAGIPLNMAVIGAFPVLIGLGIDYAIQFHARFDEEARKGSLEDAVFTTVTRTGPAVMYAMLATCMGFMAMFISDVPMIRSFGLVAIIGIFTSFWVSCLGVPTLGLLLKYRPKGPPTGQCYAVGTDACDSTGDQPDIRQKKKGNKKRSFSYGQFLTNVSLKIAKNPIPILILVSCIAVVGFQIDPLITVQTNENAFVPNDMPAKINIDKVTRIMGATSTADFYVRGYAQDLDTVKWIAGFQDYELSRHPELTGATSIVTHIFAYHGGTMPETQAELDAVLQSIPDTTRNEYTSGSMNAVIKFNTVDLEMTAQNSLKKQMVDDIAFLKPPTGITVAPTGNFELYTQMLSSLVDSKTMMTYLGFLLVFIFLVVVYRHLHAITPMIPIVLIVGWNAVMMFVLNIPYTPLTATLGSMTIGVAAEYTILVMERYAEEKERLHETLPAIHESVRRIGTAITVSGLATFFGFSALCLATFPIISNFGVTTLIAVGFSLIGAIFVMPAVLSVVGRFERPARGKGQDPVVLPEESKTA